MWLSQQSCVLRSNFVALDRNIPFWYWNEPFVPNSQGSLSLKTSWDWERSFFALFLSWLFLASMSVFTHHPSCFESYEKAAVIHLKILIVYNFRPSLQLSMELRLWQLMWPTKNRQQNGSHWSCGCLGLQNGGRDLLRSHSGCENVMIWWSVCSFWGELAPKKLLILPTTITKKISLHHQLLACGDSLLELFAEEFPGKLGVSYRLA